MKKTPSWHRPAAKPRLTGSAEADDKGVQRGLPLPLFEALVETVVRVQASPRPADRVLYEFFRDHEALGARDRAFVTENFYALLRQWESITQLAPVTAPRRLVLAYLNRGLGRSARDLQSLCRGDEERDWLTALSAQRLPATLEVRAHLPDWVVQALLEEMTEEEILALGYALQKPAPLDLRVNSLKASREQVLEALAQAGIEAAPTPLSPWGVRVPGRPALQRLPLFVEGWVEIQDEGSQLLGPLLGPRRRDMVVDFCAGAGGKSLHLGALMQNQGRLYAFDISAKRLDNLKPRLKRAGLSNLMPVVIARETDDRVRRLHGKIDRVLVDAPCSGLGTLRRNPDLKLRQNAAGLASLLDKQRSILDAAASLVKPGGRLVYATCSLLPAENQRQAESFALRHPDFRLLSAQTLLAENGVVLELDTPYLQLSPAKHGTDGFFAAAWERLPLSSEA
ncbi:MAG: RsmB/NOP family class I SAM-dependent RNA methyltransferase [Ferrovum sp.]|nr:RsmB/NOP family class I SAM-dependent RNA methyltransferase [Ferrovum sp.]